MWPLVYVIVLNYNRQEDTLRAIASLKGMTYPHFKLLLVDNHSSDATVERVQSLYPDVDILGLPQNLGFAGGSNRGIAYALQRAAEFVLLMNNDVLVDPDMLSELVKAMEPDVGASAPLIYYMSNPRQIWSAGFCRHPVHLAIRDGMRGQIDEGQWHDPWEVDYLLGCALLLRGIMLNQVGLFDERFFFYYEDLDLCIRTQNQGYRLLIVPTARMWHQVAASASFDSPFRAYHLALSSVLFFRKHTRGLRRWMTFLFRAGSVVKTTLRLLWQGKTQVLAAHWRGLWVGLTRNDQRGKGYDS